MAKREVSLVKFVQLCNHCLAERRYCDCLIQAHRYVANAELQGREVRMRPDVPPYLLRVIDAVGFDEEGDKVLEPRPALEQIGNLRAREFVEYFAAVRPQTGLHAQPER